MSKSILLSTSLAALFALLPLASGHAAEPRRLPQAAFDACQSKSAGDSCQVSLPDRSVTGTCIATPDGALACRPDHPPGPPPELTSACEGKNDGDACTATLHGDESMDGVCRRGRAGTLTCLF
jgi:hypothetical protein